MRAAGAYLRVMRERLGISQAEVARRINVSSSQVHRIEEGPGETRASLVATVAIAVEADPEDVIKLLADSAATEQIGIEMAQSRIKNRGGALTSPQIIHPEIVNIASMMTEFQLGKWVSVGERLLEERGKR